MLSKSQLLILFILSFMVGISCYLINIALYGAIFVVVGIIALFLLNKIRVISSIVIFCAFIFGILYSSWKIDYSDELQMYAPQYNAEVVGTILTNPSTEKFSKTNFLLDVEKFTDEKNLEHNIKSKMLVTIKDEKMKYKEFMAGDEVKLKGNFFIPQPAQNPSQFDYKEYLKQKNVFTVFYCEDNLYEKISSAKTNKWKFLQQIYELKNKIISINSKYIKSPYIEIVGGIVLGDDAINPPEDVKESFIKSGLFHMLAASGMNVAIIFGICFWLLRKLRVPYRMSVFAGMSLVLLYTCMTGFPVSLVRATIMIQFVLLGKIIDRSANTLALLFFAAFLLLLYNPSIINDLGFKLSFIVTLGLILMAPYFCETVAKIVPKVVSEAVCVPFIAQIWVIPVQMYYFNTFTLFALIANIVILPFFTITSFGGFACFILSLVPIVGEKIAFLLSFMLNFSANILLIISDFFAHLPINTIVTFKPSIIQIVLYYLLICSVFYAFKHKDKKLVIMSSLVFLALLSSFIHIDKRECEVIFFSVGDADMILIKSPENRYFVLDTGKLPYNAKSSQARSICTKYLYDRNIKKIQSLILSHYDSDHSGGTINLLEDFKVGNVVAPDNPLSEKLHIRIHNYIKNHRLFNKIAKNDDTIYKERNFSLRTFQTTRYPQDLNLSSVVTILSCNGVNILFMGDGNTQTYHSLKKYLPKTEIIKIGHHGAKQSIDSEMLKQSGIKTAIISSGYKNPLHPDYNVVNLLKQNKINIYTTNSENAIKIVIGKDGKTFYSYNSETKKFEPLLIK